MTVCVVCGGVPVSPLELVSGAKLGPCCAHGECVSLTWERHFDRFVDASAAERAITTWRWKRRRAEANGQPRFHGSGPLL
jgi:hypothetical protein